MSDSDNYVKILEKISEVREDMGILKSEVAHLKEGMGETKIKLAAIEQQDIQQNRLLDEHIAGVETANERLNLEIEARKEEKELIQKQIADLDKRLKKAEFVPVLFSSLRKSLKWLSGFVLAAGTIAAAIAKLLHKI